jgi:hypothetical protein
MSSQVGEYPYTLGSVLLGKMDMPKCCRKSMLVKQYDINTLADFLDKPLSVEEIKDLEIEKQKQITKVKDKAVSNKIKELDTYFDASMDKQMRNNAIMEAYKDGYTQASIAKIIGLSDAMVCMIVKKFKI